MAVRLVCQVRKCPEKTFGRVSNKENKNRWDFCIEHYDKILRHYDLVSVNTWGVRPPPIENDEVDNALAAVNAAKEHVDV